MKITTLNMWKNRICVRNLQKPCTPLRGGVLLALPSPYLHVEGEGGDQLCFCRFSTKILFLLSATTLNIFFTTNKQDFILYERKLKYLNLVGFIVSPLGKKRFCGQPHLSLSCRTRLIYTISSFILYFHLLIFFHDRDIIIWINHNFLGFFFSLFLN